MGRKETFYHMGFRLTYPDVFDHPKGLVSPMEFGDKGDGLYVLVYTYIALSSEELKAFSRRSEGGNVSEEDALKMGDAMGVLMSVAGIGGGQGPKEIAEKLQMGEAKKEEFTEVGKHGDLTYYALTGDSTEKAYLKELTPEFAEEFRTLQAALIEALKNAEYFAPQIPGAELVGKTIRFETKDIDGRPVKSEDLFSAHDVTMVNIWATWCGPCKNELEELGNIHRRLEKKNAAVIGICDDAGEKTEECRALIAEKNLSYLNILPYEGMTDDLAVEAFPTSFFVDSTGKIMTYPVIGVPADVSDYEKTIDSLLAGETAAPDHVQTGSTEEKKENACRIIVCDAEGNPVAGTMVQFCSDTTCVMGKTDAEGTASFNIEEGQKYTVHVHKAPEGYETDPEEYAVPEKPGDVRITLKKA